MTTSPSEQRSDLEALIRAYVEAFNDGDKDRCLGFYADDATLKFVTAAYRGRELIGEWLDQRFAAEAKLLHLDRIEIQGDTVVVDGVVTSTKLRAWRMPSVAGRATVRLAEGRIQEIKLGPRL